MFGLTIPETYLSSALVFVIAAASFGLTLMTDAHQERRDQKRRARRANAARARRVRGVTVRPKQ